MVMIERDFGTGALLGVAFGLVRAQAGRAGFALGMLVALAAVIDSRPDTGSLGLVPFLASIYFQYELTRAALERQGMLADGYRTRRLGALLGLCLLTQAAILLGFLLLIVPGLLLLVRWFLCVPILIREEAGIAESLQLSWEETRGRFLPLLGAVLAVYGAGIAGALATGVIFALGGAVPDPAGVDPLPAILLANLFVYAALIFGWYVAVAAYGMRRGGTATLSDVFA